MLRYDAHVWLLTDPVTRVGTSPLADVPGLALGRPASPGRLRYLTRVNRWTDLLDEGRAASSLLAATDGDPARSSLWQDCLGASASPTWRPWSVPTGSAAGPGSICGAPAVRRTRPATLPSSPTSHAVLTTGLREAQARTFVDDAAGLDLAGPAVIVLDPGLAVRTQTGWAAEALLRLNPPDEPMSPIPAAAYNVGAALLAQEAGIPVGEPRSRVHLGDGSLGDPRGPTG